MEVLERREFRITENSEVLIEKRADGKTYMVYYAIVFNKLSRDMGGWRERVLPSAVDGADFTEWVAKKNHDANYLLAASWSGTGKFEADERGIKTILLAGDSTIWNDTMKEAVRGDLRSASFEFQLAKDGVRWVNENVDGVDTDIREITKFKKIWDLSPVVVPAYPDTNGISIAKREHEQIVNQRELDQKNEVTDKVEEVENKEEASVGESIELLMAIAEC